MKHERKAQEKFWNLIQIIDEKRKISGIDTNKACATFDVSYFDFVQNSAIADIKIGTILLERLERERGIKILKRPQLDYLNSAGENDFSIAILPQFDSILEKEYGEYVAMAEDYQTNQTDHPIIKRLDGQPIIKAKSLELIAQEIGELDNGSNLIEFLVSCGVKRELIEYPQTKWRMIYSVLITLATPSNQEDQKILFKIIEEAVHPLMHNGDMEKTSETQDKISSYLRFDGLCLVNGKIVKATDELIKEIEDRQKERKNRPVDEGLQSLISKFFIPPAQRDIAAQRPIPIQIVSGRMEVDGLQDGLKEIAKIKKEDSKPKFPYKLPAGTKWENFIIQFEDDNKIFIQVKQLKHHTNYKEMGMVGKGKNPEPSEAWTFLKVLARVGGELAIKDPEAKATYKKQKEFLTEALQSYFPIEYDPFFPYDLFIPKIKQKNSYKIKITLISPPATDKKPDIEEEKDNLGIKEYLDETAPQINENE